MKTILLVFFAALSNVVGQGTFVNLNFEGTLLASNQPGGYVLTADALPGWTVRYGGTVQSQIVYNLFAGAPEVYFWSTNFAPGVPISFGRYSPAFTGNDGSGPLVSLSQMGTIPNSSTSLVFETYGSFDSLSLQLTFGGTPVSLESSWTPGFVYATWRADLSPFAGQAGELSIIRTLQPGFPGSFRLDNLQFVPIPEPSTWALLALGSAVFLCAALRRRK